MTLRYSVLRSHTRRRKRAFLVLAFPIAVLVMFVGWSLYWIGSKEKRGKLKKTCDHDVEIATKTIVPELEYAT